MTTHNIFYNPAQDMKSVDDNSIDLVITSPPYPMIEMWDDIMANQNIKIKNAFQIKDYDSVFELMHKELDSVWSECFRVLKEGGIACINIGDATRTFDKNFALYSNHSRIINGCLNLGFQNLPNIIWRKQTNSPNKFMGSGMLPPGAYVTLEHEFILIFRKGRKREFKTEKEKQKRYESSFFWEERNVWFSDLWDFKGTSQTLIDKSTRQRSAAYPFELAYRLINMFSIQGDTVLDPFLGTGTSTLAAIGSNRNSIGFEIDKHLKSTIHGCILEREDFLNQIIQNRIQNHLRFVEKRKINKGKDCFKYQNENYGFPVTTKQELKIKQKFIGNIRVNETGFEADYLDIISLSRPNVLSLN